MSFKPMPNAALTEMLARDGQLDAILDGRGLLFERSKVIEQPPPTVPGMLPPEPPNWEQERLEREARDRQARVAEAAALLEDEQPPERPTPPAKRRSWRKQEAA